MKTAEKNSPGGEFDGDNFDTLEFLKDVMRSNMGSCRSRHPHHFACVKIRHISLRRHAPANISLEKISIVLLCALACYALLWEYLCVCLLVSWIQQHGCRRCGCCTLRGHGRAALSSPTLAVRQEKLKATCLSA